MEVKKLSVKIDKLNYLILIREIVCQNEKNNKNKDKDLIVSKTLNPTIKSLDFELFPNSIKQNYTLTKLNTACKVNINYITKKESDTKQRIHPALYNTLKNTCYECIDGVEYLVFENENDLDIFKIFKRFKGVNAGFFDVETRTLKKALKTYESMSGYFKIPYNKDFSSELGPRSLMLETPESDVIYSNRVYIDFDDYFNYEEENYKIKTLSEVQECIFNKLMKNEVYKYSEKKKDNVFKKLKSEIEKEIINNYNSFSK